MHFNAGSASQKMIMDLIGSANDICMLHGVCDYLGKIKQDDLESRDRLQLVSETTSLSRASVADNLSWIAEGHLAARAATVESVFTTSARAAEGNLRLIPNRETTEGVVERANVTKDKELV